MLRQNVWLALIAALLFIGCEEAADNVPTVPNGDGEMVEPTDTNPPAPGQEGDEPLPPPDQSEPTFPDTPEAGSGTTGTPEEGLPGPELEGEEAPQ